MNYLVKTNVSRGGREMPMDQLDLDFDARTITLTGEITEESALRLNAALRALSRRSDEDITLYILSGGGSVAAGFSILDTIRSLRCDVRTCATGLAASMAAFLVAVGGTPGKRYATPHAELMIHQPLGTAHGQASDIRNMAEHILTTRARINAILAEATGKSIEQIEHDTDRDYYLSAEAALSYGLIDRIGDPFCEED